MHVCALTNAKIKLNKTNNFSNHLMKKINIYQSSNQQKESNNLPNYQLANTKCNLVEQPSANNQNNPETDVKGREYSDAYDRNNLTNNNQHHQLNKCPNLLEKGEKGEGEGRQLQKILPERQQEISSQSELEQQILNLKLIQEDDNKTNYNDSSTKTTISPSPQLKPSLYVSLPLPGVSIIKPLVGVDENLYSNLETFFHLDYPQYELLFCVQDPYDEAILVVERLLKLFPHVDAKLFIGGARVGVNPKINNMQPAYEASKYELLLISDSGISMKPDTLLDMVDHMTYDTALVHQMPFVYDINKQDFQSIVERVYFGTAHARAYLTADLLNINCPTGMSALMRKSLLDEVGGIKAFGQYLAEDFFFAKSFTDRGWKISISSQPALQNSANSSDTLTTLNSRIQRWIKLRLAMVPQWTLLEPFSECMLLGVLGAISISFLWAINPLIIFICHILIWFSLDYKLFCTIQDGPLTCSKVDFTLAWLVRESTALLIYLRALANPKVTWRSRKFRLKWGGYAEEITKPDGDGKSTSNNDLTAPPQASKTNHLSR